MGLSPSKPPLLAQFIFLTLVMRKWIEHTFFWIAFILFKVIVNLSDTNPKITSSGVSGLISEFVLILFSQLPYFILYIPVVYLLFFLIDIYFNGKVKLTIAIIYSSILLIGATFGLVIINHEFILPVVYNSNDYPLRFDWGSILYHAFGLGSVVGIAVSVKLARKQWQSKIIEQTLQKEKADTELKFLKAQVSPHFLFNTLNNIYSLARKKSSLTAESIMKLSKLLRFMLYDAANQHILLTDELKLIEDYIELEKLRYNDRLKVTFIREIDNPSQRIAPLLLIHFVENAFKHGAGESRFDIKIQIEIKLTQSVLTARFYNTKEEIPKQDQDSNIGLHNLRRQLELLYPTHRLEINNHTDQFIVELTIPLPQ